MNHRIIVALAIVPGLIFGSSIGLRDAVGQSRETGRARQMRRAPSGEVIVLIEEQFVNSFLEAMFDGPGGPSFPLSSSAGPEGRSGEASSNAPPAQNSCPSIVTLEREKGGVRTAVHFEDGRIGAQLAFSGSYSNSLLGCLRFEGWADTIINLEFDVARQTLDARATVKDIHLIGLPNIAGGPLTSLVQNALDQRINPIRVLQASQLAAGVPIPGRNGALTIMAREVRPEVTPGVLRLHITYDFAGAK